MGTRNQRTYPGHDDDKFVARLNIITNANSLGTLGSGNVRNYYNATEGATSDFNNTEEVPNGSQNEQGRAWRSLHVGETRIPKN
jgi:hypothetical protein